MVQVPASHSPLLRPRMLPGAPTAEATASPWSIECVLDKRIAKSRHMHLSAALNNVQCKPIQPTNPKMQDIPEDSVVLVRSPVLLHFWNLYHLLVRPGIRHRRHNPGCWYPSRDDRLVDTRHSTESRLLMNLMWNICPPWLDVLVTATQEKRRWKECQIQIFRQAIGIAHRCVLSLVGNRQAIEADPDKVGLRWSCPVASSVASPPR